MFDRAVHSCRGMSARRHDRWRSSLTWREFGRISPRGSASRRAVARRIITQQEEVITARVAAAAAAAAARPRRRQSGSQRRETPSRGGGGTATTETRGGGRAIMRRGSAPRAASTRRAREFAPAGSASIFAARPSRARRARRAAGSTRRAVAGGVGSGAGGAAGALADGGAGGAAGGTVAGGAARFRRRAGNGIWWFPEPEPAASTRHPEAPDATPACTASGLRHLPSLQWRGGAPLQERVRAPPGIVNRRDARPRPASARPPRVLAAGRRGRGASAPSAARRHVVALALSTPRR